MTKTHYQNTVDAPAKSGVNFVHNKKEAVPSYINYKGCIYKLIGDVPAKFIIAVPKYPVRVSYEEIRIWCVDRARQFDEISTAAAAKRFGVSTSTVRRAIRPLKNCEVFDFYKDVAMNRWLQEL